MTTLTNWYFKSAVSYLNYIPFSGVIRINNILTDALDGEISLSSLDKDRLVYAGIAQVGYVIATSAIVGGYCIYSVFC